MGGKATGSAGGRAWEGVGKPRLQRVCSSVLKPAQPSCGGPKINSFDICPLENEKLYVTRFEVEVSAKCPFYAVRKPLTMSTHSRLGGSGGPGELTEVHETTHASWHKGFRFSSFTLETHFQCFSLQFHGPTLFLVARLPCQRSQVLHMAVLGLETAQALTATAVPCAMAAAFPLPSW